MNNHAQIYKRLEPISEDEVEMLFPGAVSNRVDWAWDPGSARLFGVSEQNELHLFARSERNAQPTTFWNDLEQQLDDFNWFHYIWQEGRWEYQYDYSPPDR